MRTRTLRSVVYFAGGLGLIISLFATAEFFDASLRRICSVSSFLSCSAVDNSGLTSTLGIPDYAWGVGGFVVILLIAGLAERAPRSITWAGALLVVTTAGVALSAYLLYVEVGEIGALCLVCALAYVMGAITWVGAIALARRAPELSGHDEADNDSGTDA
jgi:uncharacterized membrane protein